MPYNNAPIERSDEIKGTSALPLARVKKIIAMDDEIGQCSTTGAFAISVATEIFIRYLTEQAYNVVKSERKPRRNIAYKDVATAISRIDNLEFLSDTVPKTKTYRQYREEKAREAAAQAASSSGATNGAGAENGSISIQDMMKNQQQNGNGVNGVNGSSHADGTDPSGPVAHRSAHQRTHSHPDPVRDIEMSG
ncbi:hypothetical protein HRR83_007649 [Exophiala dermatitidis]|uniref:DNA polymerase epsilon subunit 4 n=2 Tax=Exophiala dermatitidis TaxID=5970 RepID=H6BL53_EXODN|nr:DNA polymerase epsilon subunit 4 [Exophiala dermatitidis NIH/UT8656]KAJ4507821.1 hypothetical protein HRR75_006531 [Exophiala dermatitidis]EHY52801.1 DNA polymerase epsilon subunit 4 [Exophiala dermatitidis NIH/UT8656]KAJ4509962.1 hypothetical protein HRR74_007114 [Exophiala dermatitidis]KAJ4521787.1 hypothetical protein HRR73_002985 [Exophiala dermatitidis]KAJ4539481.1 hypothetical protein HRR77_006365 [Exophiala dermatitidis]